MFSKNQNLQSRPQNVQGPKQSLVDDPEERRRLHERQMALTADLPRLRQLHGNHMAQFQAVMKTDRMLTRVFRQHVDVGELDVLFQAGLQWHSRADELIVEAVCSRMKEMAAITELLAEHL